MQFYSTLQTVNNPDGSKIPIFTIYIDTHKTGIPEQDVVHCAFDYNVIKDKDPDTILSTLIPIITQLVYTIYGEPPENRDKQPLTDWHATGFDRNAVNGIKI